MREGVPGSGRARGSPPPPEAFGAGKAGGGRSPLGEGGSGSGKVALPPAQPRCRCRIRTRLRSGASGVPHPPRGQRTGVGGGEARRPLPCSRPSAPFVGASHFLPIFSFLSGSFGLIPAAGGLWVGFSPLFFFPPPSHFNSASTRRCLGPRGCDSLLGEKSVSLPQVLQFLGEAAAAAVPDNLQPSPAVAPAAPWENPAPCPNP